ncbi:thrombopoietin [Oryzias melastigma]|uniref:Thrombopoietin n=1 Tax=Oryzias melastigma TaxID=30732 RepID=A0A3B3E1N7_ORYME|nr:thrombopoietin [Oryzias melastigma]XP_036072300.1 thrombopoietin [Oryzias melastigma]
MALSRLLLLWMVASKVWDTEAKPVVFVCNRAARRALNIVAELESALSVCTDLMTLSSAVLLPCTGFNVATWEEKSEQEKRGDIVASLKLLNENIRSIRNSTQPGCATMLLQRLDNNIRNYLLIITNLQLNGSVLPPSLSCVPQSTQSLRRVLQSYSQLISGKLESFILTLGDRCASQ